METHRVVIVQQAELKNISAMMLLYAMYNCMASILPVIMNFRVLKEKGAPRSITKMTVGRIVASEWHEPWRLCLAIAGASLGPWHSSPCCPWVVPAHAP